ncbi:VanW family protein [Rummeliibacillus sp. G93]|uniref:VanW family protein n=1 Tax=Rummeliibacillus sp. G93 TaxID=2939494 RepID=UPI00201C7F3B|nr:VanW family protein [Rummeliibacillus sp. G93]UQW96381.1 VanW family protein [Rummeliibacillus sp. G93]
MKVTPIYKIITGLFLLSIILASASYVNLHVFAASSGSTIGSVAVEDLSDGEVKKQLNRVINKWKNTELSVLVGEEKVLLKAEDFQFDIDESISTYKKRTAKPWYAFWEKKPIVHEPLQVSATDSLVDKISEHTKQNSDEIVSQVLEAASYLRKFPLKIKDADFSIEDGERISFQAVPVKDADLSNIVALAKQLDGFIIEPNKPFSFNGFVEQAEISNDDSLSLVASALYSTVLQSSFEITERHQAEEIPTYVKPGYEAIVSPFLEKDLKFISHGTVPAKIAATVSGNELKVSLYSLSGSPEVLVYEKDRRAIEPRTIYRYMSNLAEGDSKTVEKAKPGLQVYIYRTITDKNGKTENQLMSQNYYHPINQVIETSAKQTAPIDNSSEPTTDGYVENQQGTDQGLGEPQQEESTSQQPMPSKDKNSKDDSELNSSKEPQATTSKNGGSVPKGSHYNKTGDIVTPNDSK